MMSSRAALIVALATSAIPARAGGPVDFNRDVRPILSENCFACHGFDGSKRKADLRLDTRDGLLAARPEDAPAVVVPGKPEGSALVDRIASDDPELRMPPPGHGTGLSAAQVEAVRRWIAEGAEWKGHWAYLKPTRPDVPTDPRAATPVDAFLLETLDAAGLTPSPEAEPSALIRRVTFDLTGLPPSTAEVRAFRDDDRPDAYERLVDRLLASPRHAERMASWWLDLVRFADTAGYHSDNPRNIWPYRDYVIDSFRRNTPFDRFTIEQIAGDLLPHAGTRERVASGYNRLLQTTEEGGAQAKEYAAKYAADRVRNASTVWLGATMGCAECHDHKYDPILTRDFYRFAAFFADIDEPIVGAREPGMPVPSPEAEVEIARLEGPIREARARLAAESPSRAALREAWVENHREPISWRVLEPESARVDGESGLKVEPGGILRSFGKIAAKEAIVVAFRVDTPGITGIKVEALTDPDLPGQGPGTSASGAFFLSELELAVAPDRPDVKPTVVPLLAAVSDFAEDGFEADRSIDGDDHTGWSGGRTPGISREAVFEAIAPLGAPGSGPRRLTIRLEFRSRLPQHNLGKFRISTTTAPAPSSRWVPPAVAREIAAGSVGSATEAYMRATSPVFRSDRAAVASAVRARLDLIEAQPTSLVSNSGTARPVRILPRGNWMDDSGEVVGPGVPSFLPRPDLADGRPPDRLDLAEWLASRENPLTARVYANRLWKLAFGRGLSKILDDLGSQGEWPSHPKLLDWMAVELMDSGWDSRHLLRRIVTSAAYRRSSRVTPEMAERDPYNRLLARQGRFRFEAEMVRDNALAVSGLLVEKVGGPSVKPYQPAGYWEALNFPVRTWEADRGEAQYRRAMYTFWQRTFPHPSLLAFDAPSREECTAERTRSNIPQQALALLNDPSYVEAARAFAERIVREGGADRQGRIAWAFEAATSRRPTADEARLLADLHEKHLDEYRADEAAARALLAVGQKPAPADLPPADLAAWTSVARTILNLHEAITRP